MKNIFKYLLLIALAWNLGSCQSYIDGYEQDPNNPADAPANKMLEGVILADMFSHASDLNRLSGMWMGYFTGMDRQYINLDNWAGSFAPDYDNTWGNFYQGVIAQARIIQGKAAVDNNLKLVGVAKILEAHSLGTVTSLWGDVPNTEANNVTEFPNPAYDTQESVYAYLQATLTSAIADLTGPGVIISTGDTYYGGNAAKWSKLAHSLKARYFLQTREYANAEAEAALGISIVADECWAPFGDSYQNSFSPFYSFLVYDRSSYMGADQSYAAGLLDPDDLSGSGLYRGNGKTDETARFNWNYLPYLGYYTPGYEPNYLNDFDWGAINGKFGKQFPMFTAGENLLIIAEARIRLGDEVGAINAYNTYRGYLTSGGGGFADFVADGYPALYEDYVDVDFDAGGMVNHGQATRAEAILFEIIEERYVAFAGELIAFDDWRRTDNLIGIPVKTGTQIPMRFLYPQVEVNANKSIPLPIPDFFVPTFVNQ